MKVAREYQFENLWTEDVLEKKESRDGNRGDAGIMLKELLNKDIAKIQSPLKRAQAYAQLVPAFTHWARLDFSVKEGVAGFDGFPLTRERVKAVELAKAELKNVTPQEQQDIWLALVRGYFDWFPIREGGATVAQTLAQENLGNNKAEEVQALQKQVDDLKADFVFPGNKSVEEVLLPLLLQEPYKNQQLFQAALAKLRAKEKLSEDDFHRVIAGFTVSARFDSANLLRAARSLQIARALSLKVNQPRLLPKIHRFQRGHGIYMDAQKTKATLEKEQNKNAGHFRNTLSQWISNVATLGPLAWLTGERRSVLSVQQMDDQGNLRIQKEEVFGMFPPQTPPLQVTLNRTGQYLTELGRLGRGQIISTVKVRNRQTNGIVYIDQSTSYAISAALYAPEQSSVLLGTTQGNLVVVPRDSYIDEGRAKSIFDYGTEIKRIEPIPGKSHLYFVPRKRFT